MLFRSYDPVRDGWEGAEGENAKPVVEAVKDHEGEMALTQLKSVLEKVNAIIPMLKPDSQLEAWVQSKITMADDYITTVHDYLKHTPNAVTESTGFDSFKVFKPKSTHYEPDDEYDIRAVIRYTVVLPKTGEKTIVNSLFPPSQLKTTDNKYEFNRYLNAKVADLKASGHEIVGIHYKGDPVYDKMMGRGRPSK